MVSLFVVAAGGYVFGLNVVVGNYGVSVIGLLSMLVAGQIVKVSRKEMQNSLDKPFGKRDNEIER
jgi:nitrate/nitrite transporter NarK